MEATLMGDVMPREDFAAWLAAFLPQAPRREPATLFQPVADLAPTDALRERGRGPGRAEY